MQPDLAEYFESILAFWVQLIRHLFGDYSIQVLFLFSLGILDPWAMG